MPKEIVRRLPKIYREKKSGSFCWAFRCVGEPYFITVGAEESGLWSAEDFTRFFEAVNG